MPGDGIHGGPPIEHLASIGRAGTANPTRRPGKGAAQAEAEHGITGAIKLASNENPQAPLDPIIAAVTTSA